MKLLQVKLIGDRIGYISVNKISGITPPNSVLDESCDFVVFADRHYYCLGNIDDYIYRLTESREIIRIIERSQNVPF